MNEEFVGFCSNLLRIFVKSCIKLSDVLFKFIPKNFDLCECSLSSENFEKTYLSNSAILDLNLRR